MNFKNTPKGLIKFHQYNFNNKTALEEQIDESVKYCQGKNNLINLHFTVNPAFLKEFKRQVDSYITVHYGHNEFNFNVSYSVQDTATDTIAVTMDNEPYIDENGDYLFRAGGHGALISNLNKIDSDIIFIKNIDNVCHQGQVHTTIRYKQILGGKLLEIQERIFAFLNELETSETISSELITFADTVFQKDVTSSSIQEAKEFLNRPIRICGMISNQGDAGGGPFWVATKNGVNLQIVESAQIDKENKQQKQILENSTHFNPVDIVCGVKNYKGQKFDLEQYVDHDAYFITEKSVNGHDIKALELPGLWNGGMADWLTIFVEVPFTTFNPVKTVTDLLSPMHVG